MADTLSGISRRAAKIWDIARLSLHPGVAVGPEK
jgi:hypothetical protein